MANLSIIVVAVLFGTAIVSRYFVTDATPASPQKSAPAANAKLNLSVDWSQNDRNLVMAFSTTCRFCIESSPFYKQLAEMKVNRPGVRMIVVSPQPISEVERFFRELDVPIDEFIQAKLSDISVDGTPTLLLVNKDGLVNDSWVGKLPLHGEREVISKLFTDQGGS